jgi:hypothetical protein
MTPVVGAIKTQLAIEAQYRQMFGVDLGTRPGPVLTEEQILMKAKIEVAQQYLTQRTPLPELAPLPDGYAALSPAEQMEADLERRARQLEALLPTPLRVIAGEITD